MREFKYDSLIDERIYHGFVIKKVQKKPHGIVYAVYDDQTLVVWDTNEKRAELAADWYDQYER